MNHKAQFTVTASATVITLITVIGITAATSSLAQPTIGAIRWDAWQENGVVQAGSEAALGPNHWHYRLPFFSQVTGSNSVVINGNSQAIMDQEITYAASAGIGYWAFVTYPDTWAMSHALHLYLSSPLRSRINFALDLQGYWVANGDESWNTQVARYVNYFTNSSYQKVLGNRPLVYLYYGFDSNTYPNTRFPTVASASNAIVQLRTATTNAGLGSPYIVFQGWHAPSDYTVMKNYGLDALGAYAVYHAGGGSPTGLPFATLASDAHQFWESGKATGANVVPIVTAGWDNRPFVETPVSWYPDPTTNYVLAPTPAQLADHLTDALNWLSLNRASVTPANTALIYAWNEHAEGGWICPTLNSDGTTNSDRLAALAIAGTSNARALVTDSFSPAPSSTFLADYGLGGQSGMLAPLTYTRSDTNTWKMRIFSDNRLRFYHNGAESLGIGYGANLKSNAMSISVDMGVQTNGHWASLIIGNDAIASQEGANLFAVRVFTDGSIQVKPRGWRDSDPTIYFGTGTANTGYTLSTFRVDCVNKSWNGPGSATLGLWVNGVQLDLNGASPGAEYTRPGFMNNYISFFSKAIAGGYPEAAHFDNISITTQPTPTLSAVLAGNLLVLSWGLEAAGYQLIGASTLVPPVVWAPETVSLQTNLQGITATCPIGSSARFFRLTLP